MSSARQRRAEPSRPLGAGCNAWTNCWECKGTRLRADGNDACTSCAQRAEFSYVSRKHQANSANVMSEKLRLNHQLLEKDFRHVE